MITLSLQVTEMLAHPKKGHLARFKIKFEYRRCFSLSDVFMLNFGFRFFYLLDVHRDWVTYIYMPMILEVPHHLKV